MISSEEKDLLKTGRWFRINPKALRHAEQNRLMRDFNKQKYRNLIVAAGRRSFKTERFAKRLLINECLKDKNAGKIFYAGAPTKLQSKEIFWEDLKRLAPKWAVKRTRESDMKIVFQGDSVIRVIGLKEFRRV